VLENRFKEAEFAADLFAVDSGNAEGDYATPRGFFGITFLTEGLKRVLLSALQRLAGRGGDPVIGLQTAFGGGKTHTLLAVYHLARHLREGGDPADLPGMAPLVETLGEVEWRRSKVAAFVGSAKGTDVSLTLDDGPRLHTLCIAAMPPSFRRWRRSRATPNCSASLTRSTRNCSTGFLTTGRACRNSSAPAACFAPSCTIPGTRSTTGALFKTMGEGLLVGIIHTTSSPIVWRLCSTEHGTVWHLDPAAEDLPIR
jgi:hypothetical protein